LILDESTSALDEESESIVLGSLDALKGKSTIVAIAHRGKVIAHADYTIRLTSGKLN
jgi:ABC-type bacteriocin/lantibiotic exporter with double-glycine peptidase domain